MAIQYQYEDSPPEERDIVQIFRDIEDMFYESAYNTFEDVLTTFYHDKAIHDLILHLQKNPSHSIHVFYRILALLSDAFPNYHPYDCAIAAYLFVADSIDDVIATDAACFVINAKHSLKWAKEFARLISSS